MHPYHEPAGPPKLKKRTRLTSRGAYALLAVNNTLFASCLGVLAELAPWGVVITPSIAAGAFAIGACVAFVGCVDDKGPLTVRETVDE